MPVPSDSNSTARQKELFMAALEFADATERSQFLNEACGGDDALHQRIARLLELEGESRDFLEPPPSAEPAPSMPPPKPGQAIGYFGDYILLDEIARGSSGVVFRARQSSLHRIVALKMLRDGRLLTSESDLLRFRAEAQAAAALDHPGIVPIYEVGEHEGQGYYSMKLIEGGTLHLRAGEFHDPRKAAVLMAQVARAVHHAHTRGILHRDLKPGNILLDSDGQPHIADFGLARKIGVDPALTATGQVMGTPHYMSPEQARGGGRELTAATDVYSLGAVLYELLAGRRAFASEDLIELLRQVAETPAPPLPATVPRPLAAVVARCLEKSPAARFGSAAELADDLERWLRGEPVRATRTGSAKRIPWKPLLAGAAVILLALGSKPLWPSPTSATTVTTRMDELDPAGATGTGVSLREAVRDAPPGGRITFDPKFFGSDPTIPLDPAKGAIAMEKNLELDASALPHGITLHAPAGGFRKLSIAPATSVSLKHITFTSESLGVGLREGQGGAIYNEGQLTLRDCRFLKNGGGGNGGAIFSYGGLTMERCFFEGNETTGIGGAVCVKSSSAPVRIVDCLFRGNLSHGNGGGALFVAGATTDGQVILDHCTLTGNEATAAHPREQILVSNRGSGGGVRIQAGSLQMSHCIVAGNKAAFQGGENISGEVKQTGPNHLGGDPKDAPAGLGSSLK